MPSKKKPSVAGRTYKFRHFDWSSVRYDATIGLFGARGGGKSNLALYILLNNKLRRVVVICESPEIHNKYSCIPPLYRMEEWTDEFVNSILKCQHKISKDINFRLEQYKTKMMKSIKDNHARDLKELEIILEQAAREHRWSQRIIDEQTKRAKNMLEDKLQQAKKKLGLDYKKLYDEWRIPYAIDIPIDDCSSDTKIMNSKPLKYLVNNGRHFICRVIIMVQYMVDFPKKLRGGLDYIVIFADNNEENLKGYLKYYAGGLFSSLEEFVKILEGMTSQNEGNGSMVIWTRNKKAKSIVDKVFVSCPINMDVEEVNIGSTGYHAFSQAWAKDTPASAKDDEKGGGEDNGEDSETEEQQQSALFQSLLAKKVEHDKWQDMEQKKVLADIQAKSQKKKTISHQRQRLSSHTRQKTNSALTLQL